jgi:PAS domain S-box-containing protein
MATLAMDARADPRAAGKVSRDNATRTARLQRWIVALGVIAIVAIAGSSAYDAWRSYRRAIADTNRELANVGKALAEQLEVSLQPIDTLLQSTASWYAALPPRTMAGSIDEALSTRAATLPQVSVLSIVDADSVRRYASGNVTLVGDSEAQRSYFIAQRDNPNAGLYVSEPIVSKSRESPAFVLSRRIFDAHGRFEGVVTAEVELDEYQRFYHAINLGTKSAISLLREDGTLLLRQPSLRDSIGKRYPSVVERASASESMPTTKGVSPIDGVPRFVVATRLPRLPLVIVVARDRASVLNAWRAEAYDVGARTLLIMLLGTLAIIVVNEQLRRIDRGEGALRESEARYALTMEGANEGHWDWVLDGSGSYLSPTMKALHGCVADRAVGTRSEWFAAVEIHPDDRARFEAAVRDHLAERTERYDLEYRVRHPDGEWHWLQERGRCMRDAQGKPTRFIGSAIDITGRKVAEAEKERLEAQLRQSQKMEAMGTLAGGIAHDFNNVLGAILGYGELAQNHAPEASNLKRYINNIMHAASRAKALVEQVLVFSRSGVGARVAVNVQAVVAEAAELLSASLPPGIRLLKRFDAGNAAVLGDATELHQVVMNLCTNAVQAMGESGVLDIALGRRRVVQERPLSHGSLAPGEYVRLDVSDTGNGIPVEALDRIFDPFFTTKGVGKGTGLGLSLVHGIILDLGGAIDLKSTVGRGTVFTIWLPIAGETNAPLPERKVELPHGDGQTVLVVDDEPALVALAEEILAELGFEPVGFHSSVAALQAVRYAPRRFDAVLTDEAMPELSGIDFAREVRSLRPDIPVLLMSGYASLQLMVRARSAGIGEVLRKPLRQRDIALSLARALGEPNLAYH